MSEETNVEGLRQSIGIAKETIGGVQSALHVATTRAEGALAVMGRLAEGSNNDQLQAAITAIASIPITVEELVGKAAEAVDALNAYEATR